tara:strand:+ start:151 stop:2355 length:2205 start_codon:yes stop_codon:yes gene_type:complete
MKKITILFLFISSLSLINAQSSDIDSVKALKVDRNIVTLSQSTKDKFDSNGLTFYINQYYNVSDWNNDGLGDLVVMVGYNDALNDDNYLSLFLQKKTDQKIEFIEDPNYLMSIQGHIEDFNSSVGDLNGDNLLDIVVPTHNYHGPEGKQPSYYLGKNETTDKLFINTGTGLTRFELDTTTIHQNQNYGGVPEHMPTSGITVIDWDFDGKLEILVSDQAYRRIREVSNPVKDKLFSSFEIDANNNITREFVFDLDFPLGIPESDSKYIHTRMHFLSVMNDTLYLLHYKRKGWDIENLIFVDENVQRPNNQEIVSHADAKVLVIDMKKSFGKEGLIKEITLESTHKGGDLIYQDGFHPSDIDNDGKVEFIAMYWYESKHKQVPFIKIYDDDGTDVTDKWLGDKYMETSKKGGGNGLQMGDFNNDGFIDFTPKDGWYYNAQRHIPPKVKGDYGTFAIFLNDGEKFEQYNVDFHDFSNQVLNYGGGSQLKRNPVDFDNDGYYEFMIIKDQVTPPPNIDIVTVDYTSFDWISSAVDTVNISKNTINDDYTLEWGTSTVKSSVNYLVYAKVGFNPPEEIYDTTVTKLHISNKEFLNNIFESFPTVSAATVRFSVSAIYGSDTVKVTGDDRVVYVNRYEFLSTEGEGIPTEFALHENYPNPFNPSTTLRFDLPEVSDVNVVIYNMLGQKVRTFNMNSISAGSHSIKWNATNDYGDPVSAGIYLYQLQAKDFVKTRKMVLLK